MLGWLSWCIWRRKQQPYVWKCVGFIVGLQLLLGLELGDFPPIFWTFDAHSLWHAGTAPLCLLWYRYVDVFSLNIILLYYKKHMYVSRSNHRFHDVVGMSCVKINIVRI